MNKDLLALLERAFGQLGAGSKYALGEMASYYQAEAAAGLGWWVLFTVIGTIAVFKWIKPAIVKQFELDAKRGYRDWDGDGITAAVASVILGVVWIGGAIAVADNIGVIIQPTGYVFAKIVSALR